MAVSEIHEILGYDFRTYGILEPGRAAWMLLFGLGFALYFRFWSSVLLGITNT